MTVVDTSDHPDWHVTIGMKNGGHRAEIKSTTLRYPRVLADSTTLVHNGRRWRYEWESTRGTGVGWIAELRLRSDDGGGL